MSKEAFVGEVKRIVGLLRGGEPDTANAAFGVLFESPVFAEQRPEDRRQALKLLILAKRSGAPTASVVTAFRSALEPLEALVGQTSDPEDYEMVGVCRAVLGHQEAAAVAIREGLRLERERNPQSDLCGRLMTRLSSL